MATRYLPRSAWNARPREHAPGELDPAEVRGLAFHWPGVRSSRPVSRAAVPRALRSWQDYHMDVHGWSDIAYQVAIDQWGRVWTLRGLENRSAANGGWHVNSTHGAILLVLVQGERPSRAMRRATRQVVRDFRRRFPHAEQLVGHGVIRPNGWTECPGPAVRAALRAGELDPKREEIEMTEEELRKVIREEINRASWGAVWRLEQLVRELVRRGDGAGPLRVLKRARARRKAAR